MLLGAAARAALERGLELPYELRPALVAEMLRLYDHVRRLGRSVADFDRNFRNELEREQDTDRGAFRLLQQTVFLAAVYTAYEQAQTERSRLDEHGLRDLLSRTAAARPMQHIIVTVADRVTDPDGLWPADFDLLTRLPGLRQIDVLCTEGTLGAGHLERLYGAFPELQEERAGSARTSAPVLIVPEMPAEAARDAAAVICFTHRDREEELLAVARRLKRQRREGQASPLHRTALVVRRPLPYLYLARDVFADAAIPFEALDTLPLAAEPYAAAVDVVLDCVAADFTRSSVMALLRSPHFRLDAEGPGIEPSDAWRLAVNACDSALAEARFLGGLDRLQALLGSWASDAAPAHREQRRRKTALPALQAVLSAVTRLHPLAEPRPLVAQIDLLLDWLKRFDRPDAAQGATHSRRQRVRGAVFGALAALRDAYALHDPNAEGDVATLTAAIRRWLGAQTFALPSGEPGLQLVDAQAARYGEFDDLQLVGLIDGEWPERTNRNVLYPTSLLVRHAGAASDRARSAGPRPRGHRASDGRAGSTPAGTHRCGSRSWSGPASAGPTRIPPRRGGSDAVAVGRGARRCPPGHVRPAHGHRHRADAASGRGRADAAGAAGRRLRAHPGPGPARRLPRTPRDPPGLRHPAGPVTVRRGSPAPRPPWRR